MTDLAGMPSAAGQDRHWRTGSRRKAVVRAGIAACAVAATLLGLCAAVVLIVGMTGWGTETLRVRAEKAIEAAAGFDVTAAIGPTRITLDGARLVALQLTDVDVRRTGVDAPVIKAGVMHFGVRLLPLLLGDVRLGGARIADARIDASALPSVGGRDWTASLRDERGLFDPDRLASAIFKPLQAAFNAVESGSVGDIELENIDIVLPEGERIRVVRIVSGLLSDTGNGTLAISAEADVDARRVAIVGDASRDPATRTVTGLRLRITSEAQQDETAALPSQTPVRVGSFDMTISGHEGGTAAPTVVNAVARLDRSTLDLGLRGMLAGDILLDATLATGSNKVEINRLRLSSGRTVLDFNGAFGPLPFGDAPPDRPAYRYELVSSRSVMAPEGSPEAPLSLTSKVRGTYDPASHVLSADDMAVSSGDGQATGAARLEFAAGKAPGIALALAISDMQVAHVKQLWPWFSASKARLWVLDHLFGGRVSKGSIRFEVPAGRLGNGVPLNGDEVSAHFEVDGTRFDTTGMIPPIRDATGTVDVRGNDSEIALSSGSVFMSSGRTVSATNGRLVITAANVPPVIGKLDIDISGRADAVAELASYEPINAMNRIGMKPEDFSGTMSGHITADIPFQKNTDLKTLDWHVDLDFSDLGIAKPFDGQTLSDAKGSIVIEPDHAGITGAGKLNGVPATLALVEPLRPDGPERKRDVQLVFSDAARDALAPGLATLISGPVKVAYASAGGGKQIEADLTAAKLTLPWVGWSKGAGIAAKATFGLSVANGATTLSDFDLSGKTFGVKGNVVLTGGGLSSARLDKVSLNRGDDVSVTIARASGRYKVGVKGDTLDARALVKQVTADGGPTQPKGFQVPVSLHLEVGNLIGFNDETLSGVGLDYDGSTRGVNVSATTRSGRDVVVKTASGNGGRRLLMQSGDAGALLRFLDVYRHLEGGKITFNLAGDAEGSMRGSVDASNFWVVNEPKLASIVSTAPAGSERSLNEAVRKDIDTSRVQFERGYAQIVKGPNSLQLNNGVLRGPLIGTTFQGTLYNADGRMDMTGTFMPAYGLNRIFGELPLIGTILGNGRDRGLIGVTYKLAGDAKAPQLQINPLSVMAPGIFRSIFEFQ